MTTYLRFSCEDLAFFILQLEQICISFDGGKTTMNFIEAALLIQGSACIYSKKVEYLYSLVYQALDFISNKKREKLPTSVGADGADSDANAGPAEEKDEFLSLNDIQDTSRASMDLREDRQRSSVSIVPLTPMVLVPPEEAEKKGNPLFSKKGEMLASRRDFRMNTCTPHVNGTFMLQLADLSPTQCPPRRDRECPSMGVPSIVPGAGATPVEGSVCNTPVLALNFSGDGGGDNAFCENDDGCNDILLDIPERVLDASLGDVEDHVAYQMVCKGSIVCHHLEILWSLWQRRVQPSQGCIWGYGRKQEGKNAEGFWLVVVVVVVVVVFIYEEGGAGKTSFHHVSCINLMI
uniref:Condensin-2 complex subunit H2 n=1 Tax=Anolis carolinensis TaxID=28377 RepID=H9GJL1_ANOCA